MLFDTHAHYDDERFDADRDELLSSMQSNGVSNILNASYDMPSSFRSIDLANKYDFIYAAIGVHPHDSKDMKDEDFDKLEELASNEKVVAIGEIGLDYYYDNSPRDIQKEKFDAQIALAKKLKLPFIVHERDACSDCLDILKSQGIGDRGGVIHCFSGSKETAKILLDMGMMISIGGPVTFKNAVKAVEAVEYVPLDRLFIETDCPYLTPHPYRGQRNSSLYVKYVAEKIAEIKNISFEEVAYKTSENAKKFFKIV